MKLRLAVNQVTVYSKPGKKTIGGVPQYPQFNLGIKFFDMGITDLVRIMRDISGYRTDEG